MKRREAWLVMMLWSIAGVGAAHAASAGTQRRCGWFDNPTPGDAWLHDRDGEWTIGIQGGHQASGDWPAFSDAQWVVTNSGQHGHGCACLTVQASARTHEVTRIVSARAQALSVCRSDRALHEPR